MLVRRMIHRRCRHSEGKAGPAAAAVSWTEREAGGLERRLISKGLAFERYRVGAPLGLGNHRLMVLVNQASNPSGSLRTGDFERTWTGAVRYRVLIVHS